MTLDLTWGIARMFGPLKTLTTATGGHRANGPAPDTEVQLHVDY